MEVVYYKPKLNEQRENLDQLLKEIQERRVQPEDRYEMAALLESMGWTDERAAKTFGVSHIFELASHLWELSNGNVIFTPFSKEKKMGVLEAIRLIVSNFLRGAIFALPMAVSVFSMITLRFSLWSYENLSVELATAIAIGTIFSFITVGGFTQAIARRGFFYIIQGYYRMARRVTFHFIAMGTVASMILSGLVIVVNMLIPLFPNHIIVVILLYYFFLNTIWLSVTIMYILRKELVFTALIIIGIIMVYILFAVFHVNIIVSQLVSLLLVSLFGIALAHYFFKKAEAKAERGIEPNLPKMSVTVYNSMPYFVYGILYFTFLFVDRIMAWSVDNAFLPYVIWFRGDYELGLDFSMLVLIIPMGINEVVLNRLMTNIQLSQKSYLGQDIEEMNKKYIKEYFLRAAFILMVSIASAVGLYYFVGTVMDYFNPQMGEVIYHNPITHFVFIVSLIGYVLLAVALMNVVTLFSLSQPHKVIKSIIPALLVNVVLGFVLSRWFGYEYAVLGFLVASLVFVVLSLRQVYSVLKKLDYYMYAAS
ncbi:MULTISPECIES: hypothetical protein [unclassified Paenibacillus]|uniref:hypothetical protein n=1 Tax=unclassified Paenibacillus TaxID=185978 RepID=UPI001AE30E6B|nr:MULTISPECIES: hypothetical protein [unclassified Paenibacillus]MBP1154264.1 putative membrane protein [Paenibacillus sp. PvP091]MBP1170351.1 putative membrane protein [Paenibacillus sp. PvR098]MBP2441379.1 putative membrane protein [Paenibacillus sp. PvP052]